MSDQNATVSGVAADVPYVALPPAGWDESRESAPLIIAWHLNDPPRSAAAMASALPLEGAAACCAGCGRPRGGCCGPRPAWAAGGTGRPSPVPLPLPWPWRRASLPWSSRTTGGRMPWPSASSRRCWPTAACSCRQPRPRRTARRLPRPSVGGAEEALTLMAANVARARRADAGVLEGHDAVAQQALSLFGMRRHEAGRLGDLVRLRAGRAADAGT